MLDRLAGRPRANHRKKRVGRGPGSGIGKTAGRGVKGQGKRSAGRETPLWFEGGQMPLARRLPKRGFHNRSRKTFRIVNLAALAGFGEGARVDVAALEARGLVRQTKQPVKVLAQGEPPRNLTLAVHAASASARKKIEEAGGKVETVA